MPLQILRTAYRFLGDLKPRRKPLLVQGAILAMAMAAPIPCAFAQDLLGNGAFEVGPDEKVSGWEFAQGEVVTVDGERALAASGPVVQGGIEGIEKGAWYRIRGRVRGEGIPSGRMLVVLKVNDKNVLFLSQPVDSGWTLVDKTFYSEDGGSPATLTLDAGYVGRLLVGRVRLERVPEPEFAFTRVLADTDAKNLVPNSSFECGPHGWSTLGDRTSWGPGLSGFYGTVVEGDAAVGGRSVRLDFGPGKTEVTSFNMFPVTGVVQHRPLMANVGWIPVESGRPYTLSAYLRASATGIPVRLLVRSSSPLEHRWDITNDSYHVHPFSYYPRYQHLTTDWKRYSFTVVPQDRYAFVAVGADLSSLPDTEASVWIDGVQFEQGELVTPYEPREPVEVGIHTREFGNVFDHGQPVILHVDAHSHRGDTPDLRVRIEVRDFLDDVVLTRDVPVSLGPDAAAQAIDLGLERKGYYTFRAAWSTPEGERQTELRAAVIQPYRHDDSLFGVNHAPPADLLCRQLVRAGHLWARDWSVNWQHLEPEPGKLSFAHLDPHVARVLGTGMRLMCMLPAFPSSDWASEAPDEAEQRWQPHSRIWWRMAYAPKDLNAFAGFVRAVVDRYSDRVRYWEYLNEPLGHYITLPTGAPSFANYTVDDYIRLLKVQYESAKQADPDAQIIGGLGAEPESLHEFIEKGGLAFVDIANIHIYPGHRRPESFIPAMEELQRRMAASPEGVKPLWMTEYAYSASDHLPYTPYALGPMEWQPDLLRDEAQLAAYSVRYAAIMLAGGVEKFFYHYAGATAADVNDDVEILQSPLLAHAGTPRRLYPAQSALANLLGPRPAFRGALDSPDPGDVDRPYAYAFDAEGASVVVAWATGHADDGRRVPLPDWARALDIMGNPIEADSVRLGEIPLYLVSEDHSAETLLAAVSEALYGVGP